MNEHSQQMIAYITRDILRNSTLTIEPDTPLISSGLVDSFALVDILVRLEEVTGRKIPAGEVQAHELDTVRSMLSTAERLGRPQA